MTRRQLAGLLLVISAVAGLARPVTSAPAPAAPADATTTKRLAEPDAAAQAKAEKLVKDLFKAGYAKRKPAERVALARDLMKQAEQTADDPAGRFVLLREARDVAAAAGDVELALAAAEALSAAYRVDPLAAKMAALAAAPLGDRKAAGAAAAAYVEVSEQALAAEDLDLAAKAAAQSQAAARKAGDKTDVARAAAQAKAVAVARKDQAAATAAETRLAEAPDDPKANLTLGRYLCFVKGDWDRGLPMLAKGSEPALKALATKELAGPADAAAMADLADAWWDLPDGRGGVSAAQARRRTAYWYEKALPKLTGLRKATAEKRIAEAAAASPTDADPPAGRVVDLLPLVDPARDAVAGAWRLDKRGLAFDGSVPCARVRLPYAPPAEYDFEIEYTRESPRACVIQLLSYGQPRPTGFKWIIGYQGELYGFDLIKGRTAGANETTVRDAAIAGPGERHRSVVRVRKGSIAGCVNGKLVSKHRTDYSDLTMEEIWSIGDDALGVALTDGPAVIHAIRVTEVTGRGKPLPRRGGGR